MNTRKKIHKKAPLRALLYTTGLYLMAYSFWELSPQSVNDWCSFIGVLATGCLVVLATFTQACSELHRGRVPGAGVLHPDLVPTQPTFIEPQLGRVSMVSFVRRRP